MDSVMEKRDKNGLTEAEFLAAYKPGDYEHPSVTVDIMVFRMKKDLSGLQVLLIKRGGHPYLDCLALPGGFIGMNESGYEAAQRELEEETGICASAAGIFMEQSYTMTRPDRDPRMRVISIAYTAVLPYGTEAKPRAGDDAVCAEWYDVSFDGETLMKLSKNNDEAVYTLDRKVFENGKLSISDYIPVWKSGLRLAFDHSEILSEGLKQLQDKAEHTDIVFNLVPDEFTLPMLKNAYRILSCKDKSYTQTIRRMKRKIEETGSVQKSSDRPPAKLFKYKKCTDNLL